MVTNPIQYSSRTFSTVMADINADPTLVDKPDWIKRIFAGIMDVLSNQESLSANQAFLRTALTRQAVLDNAQLIDYYPAGTVAAGGTLYFDLKGTTGMPYTVAQPDVAAAYPGTVSIPAKRFEARAGLTFTTSTEVTANTAWTVADDKITVASIFTTGEKVWLTFTGTPPTTVPQVAISTDYFVIYVDATHIRLAISRANAFAGTYIDITAQGTGNHTLTRLSRPITAYQQTSVLLSSIGVSDGSTAWQEFRIPQAGVLNDGSLSVTINSIPWTVVSSPINSISTDKVFRFVALSDGSAKLRFGNGIYGAIPGPYPIYCNFAYSSGSQSNVATINAITTYAGTDQNVTGVWNSTAFSGGADPEALATTKILGPLLLKTRDRFVTVADGQSLVLSNTISGVSQCLINKNTYGTLSCQVIGVAKGSQAAPTSPNRASIAAYLQAKSALSGIDVHFDAGTFTTINMSTAASVSLFSGYSSASVFPYMTVAWNLLLSPAGNEILSNYTGTGSVAAAVTSYNTIFGTSFVSTDYGAFNSLLTQLGVIGPMQFNYYLALSKLDAFIQGYVAGVNYIAWGTFSLTLPYQCGTSEILVPGTTNWVQV